MKHRQLPSAALLVSFCVSLNLSADTLRLSEPVHTSSTHETFGQSFDNALPIVSLSALKEKSAFFEGKAFQLETRIAKVCQKKGCFFIAQQGEHIMRVSFKDYGFFVPTDSANKTVTLNGELVAKTLSEEQAQHFNTDLKSDEISSGKTYEIVAHSVMIPL